MLLHENYAVLNDINQIGGYLILVKATGGGGGIGVQICNNDNKLLLAIQQCRNKAELYFDNNDIYIEKYYPNSRHIEVQVFGNDYGEIIHLGTRECSIQRRYQKIIEESPSPFFLNNNDIILGNLYTCVIKLAKSVNYNSVGTIEFLLVENGPNDDDTVCLFTKWYVEVRICVEDPNHDYIPSSGLITFVKWPNHYSWLRIDTWITIGTKITSNYDSLLAKIIVHGNNRNHAIKRMNRVLEQLTISGPITNIGLLKNIFQNDDFSIGGTETTIQNYPGQLPLRVYGIQSCGPMDQLSCQLANLIVGNQLNSSEDKHKAPIPPVRKATQFTYMKKCLDLMMDDEIAFQNEKEWIRLFPSDTDAVYESFEFIKCLFIITLSTISSNRNLFPSNFYAQKRPGTLNVQLFDHHCTNVEQTAKTAIIFDWIGGISQAIAEKYLKMASFIIVSKDVERSILETFLFLFSYHDENTDNHHKKISKKMIYENKLLIH
ncbi:unnamed protein product [Didymodactylos carnosus]|uniref:Biotin carboxylation domain-containing protein n=1 Tax=Didymodactylos carnosus TaxID=1234261 RepID=A0A8S2DF34_9BILA|nr:unnamed protein product [Didymodactylos carnosus]CAF3725371.1 unnamed protein product [Didymodactylos carnosus]